MNDTDNPVTLPKALGHLALSLGSWALMTGASYVIIRMVSSPDFARTAVMRTAHLAERYAQRRAETWAHRADAATRLYDTMRPVGV